MDLLNRLRCVLILDLREVQHVRLDFQSELIQMLVLIKITLVRVVVDVAKMRMGQGLDRSQTALADAFSRVLREISSQSGLIALGHLLAFNQELGWRHYLFSELSLLLSVRGGSVPLGHACRLLSEDCLVIVQRVIFRSVLVNLDRFLL